METGPALVVEAVWSEAEAASSWASPLLFPWSSPPRGAGAPRVSSNSHHNFWNCSGFLMTLSDATVNWG